MLTAADARAVEADPVLQREQRGGGKSCSRCGSSSARPASGGGFLEPAQHDGQLAGVYDREQLGAAGECDIQVR